ncbi:MAG TPA: hypothetical protein VG675_20360 [Bryobacteraceae bacterium]|nr:hypothetical protein [Bryobacteraceae bacterium]
MPCAIAPLLCAASAAYLSAQRKIDLITNDRLKPGTRVEFTPLELNAYAAEEAPRVAPGVRNPRITLGAGQATATALVDFGKLRRAQGEEPSWLVSKLIDGERPVSVTARIQSGGGRATVTVERVEISGVEIQGSTLDFLIRNFLLPLYPDAAVGRPFELGHHIQQIEVRPSAVGVLISH